MKKNNFALVAALLVSISDRAARVGKTLSTIFLCLLLVATWTGVSIQAPEWGVVNVAYADEDDDSDDDTAATLCASGEVLDGDGNCVVLGTSPANVSCAVGEVVSGFDTEGNLICVPRGRPLTPVLSSVIGPFNDLGTLITPFCFGDSACEAAVAPLNMLNRYEVNGIGEPRALATLYVDGVCNIEVTDFFEPICRPLIPDIFFQDILCTPPGGPGLIGGILSTPIGTAQVSDGGSFMSLVVTDGSIAVISASLIAEASSDCSASANLP